MAMGEAVGVEARRARERATELGQGDHQVADADVRTDQPGVLARGQQGDDGLLQRGARRQQFGVFAVEPVGEHRTQGADPLVRGGVREPAQGGEGVGLLGEEASAEAVTRPIVKSTT